jgi:hypothetical protein
MYKRVWQAHVSSFYRFMPLCRKNAVVHGAFFAMMLFEDA